MKLFSLIAAVFADTIWDGVSKDNTCGMQISGANMVNRTCTISGASPIKSVFAGNGAFITDVNEFTGFDGISGDLDVVVFFEQPSCNNITCYDNSTCWDASVSCVDNVDNAGLDGIFFMESVNDDRGAQGSYNLQIVGVEGGDFLSIDLDGWVATNITAPFGEVHVDGVDGTASSFGVNVWNVPFGALFQISVTSADENQGALNLWKSSVTRG